MKTRPPNESQKRAQQINVLMLPGHTQCPHCGGYGSSLKDPLGVDTCTVCLGAGFLVFAREGVHHVQG